MQKKDAGFVPEINFKKQTPEVFLEAEKPDPFYEEAFFSHEDKCTTEYAQNTTTWD